eukprot:scaffold22292_cov62-Phaeocystis_antarctica.AAC.1
MEGPMVVPAAHLRPVEAAVASIFTRTPQRHERHQPSSRAATRTPAGHRRLHLLLQPASRSRAASDGARQRTSGTSRVGEGG